MCKLSALVNKTVVPVLVAALVLAPFGILWVGGFSPLLAPLACLAAVFTAVFPHETGHALTARALGGRLVSIDFGAGKPLRSIHIGTVRVTVRTRWTGGKTIYHPPADRRFGNRLALVAVAGPAANLIIGSVCCALWHLAPAVLVPVGLVNLGFGLANLVPHAPRGTGKHGSDGYQALTRLGVTAAARRRRDLTEVVYRAARLITDGDHAQAVAVAAQGVLHHPGDDAFLATLASAEAMAEDWAVRGQGLERIRVLLPSPSITRETRALLANERSYHLSLSASPAYWPEALVLAEYARRVLPQSVPVMDTMALALVRAGRFAEADQLCRQILRADAADKEAANRLRGYTTVLWALMAIRYGDWQRATMFYDEALQLAAKSKLLPELARSLGRPGATLSPGDLGALPPPGWPGPPVTVGPASDPGTATPSSPLLQTPPPARRVHSSSLARAAVALALDAVVFAVGGIAIAPRSGPSGEGTVSRLFSLVPIALVAAAIAALPAILVWRQWRSTAPDPSPRQRSWFQWCSLLTVILTGFLLGTFAFDVLRASWTHSIHPRPENVLIMAAITAVWVTVLVTVPPLLARPPYRMEMDRVVGVAVVIAVLVALNFLVVQRQSANQTRYSVEAVSCESSARCIAFVNHFEIRSGGESGNVESPSLLVTDNGGRSWTSVQAQGPVSGMTVTGAACESDDRCTVVASDTAGDFHLFTLVGTSFQPVGALDNSSGDEVQCGTVDDCFAYSDTALTWTSNGGRAWQPVPVPGSVLGSEGVIVDATCVTEEQCLVAVAQSSGPTMARTVDGGRNWVVTSIGTGDDELTGLECSTPSECLATTSPSDSDSGEVVLHSTDGGATWRVTASLDGTDGIPQCTPSGFCIDVGDPVSSATLPISISHDGGAHWLEASGPATGTAVAISCPTSSQCVGVGTAGTSLVSVRSVDAGREWTSSAIS